MTLATTNMLYGGAERCSCIASWLGRLQLFLNAGCLALSAFSSDAPETNGLTALLQCQHEYWGLAGLATSCRTKARANGQRVIVEFMTAELHKNKAAPLGFLLNNAKNRSALQRLSAGNSLRSTGNMHNLRPGSGKPLSVWRCSKPFRMNCLELGREMALLERHGMFHANCKKERDYAHAA